MILILQGKGSGRASGMTSELWEVSTTSSNDLMADSC